MGRPRGSGRFCPLVGGRNLSSPRGLHLLPEADLDAGLLTEPHHSIGVTFTLEAHTLCSGGEGRGGGETEAQLGKPLASQSQRANGRRRTRGQVPASVSLNMDGLRAWEMPTLTKSRRPARRCGQGHSAGTRAASRTQGHVVSRKRLLKAKPAGTREWRRGSQRGIWPDANNFPLCSCER